MNQPQEVRALAPTSVLGGGFRAESLERAMAWEPHFIGCDAGSTDSGPYYLGSGEVLFSQTAVSRDLELMMLAAHQARIPLLIGSAQTGGADGQLQLVVDLVEGLARKHSLSFRLATVGCEPPRAYLKQLYREGRVRPLAAAPPIDEDVFDRSAHVVAMAGAEVFDAALAEGADVVVSGRCSDAALFAAIPTARGLAAGPSWHAGKILECGAAAVVNRKYPDPLFAWICDDHFVVEPPNPEYRCSPVSVASHTLYENGSPYRLVEPSGTLVCDDCTYDALNERSVRVAGSRFEPAPRPTFKLEGAELVGYQSLILGAVRDPVIIRQLDSWLEGVLEAIRNRVTAVYGEDIASAAAVTVRRYGIDASLGPLEPQPLPGHEVGLVFEVTAGTQELARSIAKSAMHIALHYAVPEWTGLITTLALPYSPAELDRGPVYRFNLNHVIEPERPLDPFAIEVRDL